MMGSALSPFLWWQNFEFQNSLHGKDDQVSVASCLLVVLLAINCTVLDCLFSVLGTTRPTTRGSAMVSSSTVSLGEGAVAGLCGGSLEGSLHKAGLRWGLGLLRFLLRTSPRPSYSPTARAQLLWGFSCTRGTCGGMPRVGGLGSGQGLFVVRLLAEVETKLLLAMVGAVGSALRNSGMPGFGPFSWGGTHNKSRIATLGGCPGLSLWSVAQTGSQRR